MLRLRAALLASICLPPSLAGQAQLTGTPVSLPPGLGGALRAVALPGDRVAVWSTDSAEGAILDRGTNRVHRLDARNGGAFAIRRNTSLTLLGDTVVAQDVSANRWVFLPADGGRGRTAMAPTGPLNENNQPAARGLPVAGGAWIFVPQGDTLPQPVQVARPDGSGLRRIGSFSTPAAARMVIGIPNVGSITTSAPFAASDRVYVSPTGREVLFVTMTGGRPGDSSTVTLRVVGLDGTLAGQSQLRMPIPADAASAVPAWKTNLLNGIPANFRPGFEAAADQAVAAFAHFGPFTPLGWLADDGLWGKGSTANGITTWLRIDPRTGAQRAFSLAESCSLLDVAGRSAWWSCTTGGATTLHTGALPQT